jgi:phosphohistidine phosphatase
MTANRLYFAQHGLALSETENPNRPLSEAGISQTKIIATALHRSGTPVSSIFHSGKLRALQTAEIFASLINISTISVIDHLSPNDDVTLTAQNFKVNNALYVGHLPHIEKLVSYLVTGNENQSVIKFQNSAVVCLEKNETGYHILWYITADLNKN